VDAQSSLLLALLVVVSVDPLVVTDVVTGPAGRPRTGCRVFAMRSATAGNYPTAIAAARCSGLGTDEAGTPIAAAAVRLGTLTRRYELHWSEYGRKLYCGDESPLAATTRSCF